MHISQKLWVMVVIARVVRLFRTGTLTTYYRRPIKGSCSELFKLAKQPIKGSQNVCRSLEEFCSLLSDILWRFAMLQDPGRSGYLCGARIDPLLLNPSSNPNLYINT